MLLASKPDNEWIDVTVGLQAGMVNWPGDPKFEIHKLTTLEKGDDANISVISSCVHIGTHVDAPLHFFQKGYDVTAIPLATLIGKARVIEIQNAVEITREEIEQHNIKKGERILFKTKASGINWTLKPFNPDYVALTIPAASYLAETRVCLVGIDYLSIAQIANSTIVHRALLDKNICIVEGLDLSNVNEGDYDMICLPLKISNSDGSPARVVLKKLFNAV
jgi:arylformamidase